MQEMKSEPWSKILAFYKDLFSLTQWHHTRGLVLLAEGILESPYAEHIHGCTSHEILYIAQTPKFAHTHEVLAITPDPKTDQLIFEWKGSAWVRQYAKGAANPSAFWPKSLLSVSVLIALCLPWTRSPVQTGWNIVTGLPIDYE